MEVKDYFDFGEAINIDELEKYVTENREELTREDSDEFSIDLSQMMQANKPSTTLVKS